MWKVIVADDEPFIREALKEMIPWDELGCHLARRYLYQDCSVLLEHF